MDGVLWEEQRMSMSKFRLAEAKDAESFAKWVTENPQISPEDLEAGKKKNNPTVVFFAVEDETGKVVCFAPFYAQMTLAYLGFNPDSDAAERKEALTWMLNGAMAWAVQYNVHEITTVSQEHYPVARWALNNGLELEPRQLLKFDINRVLAEEALTKGK